MNVRVTFPKEGLIHVEGEVFADSGSDACRRFLDSGFFGRGHRSRHGRPGKPPRAELRFAPDRSTGQEILARLARLLGGSSATDAASSSRPAVRSFRAWPATAGATFGSSGTANWSRDGAWSAKDSAG